MLKKIIAFLFLFLFSIISYSQICPDIFESLNPPSYQKLWEDNVSSILEKEYQVFDKTKKGTKVDSTILMNNTKVKIAIFTKKTSKYKDNIIVSDIESQGLKSKETVVLNSKNQAVSRKIEFANKSMAETMNINTYFDYNDSGRITKKINKKCAACDSNGLKVTYNADNSIIKLTSFTNIGNYVFDGLKVPKATLYDSKVEDSMISKEILEHSKLKLRDTNYRYLVTPLANNMMKYEALMKSKDTIRYAMMWRKIRDVNHNLLAEEAYNGKEKLVNKKYTYTPQGRLKSYGDLIANTSFVNTFTPEGKPLEEKDFEFNTSKYSYDDKGNWVKKEVFTKNGEFVTMVVRVITYK
jgi:hypothetical protein